MKSELFWEEFPDDVVFPDDVEFGMILKLNSTRGAILINDKYVSSIELAHRIIAASKYLDI